MQYADIIVDISSDSVDRPFEYIIPENLEPLIKCGSQVIIPFGRGGRKIKGFVINIKDKADYDMSRLKYIDSLVDKGKTIESDMIELAAFIRENYGSTMNRALKIVLPVKTSSAPLIERYVAAAVSDEIIKDAVDRYSKDKRTVAKRRLLQEILNEKVLSVSLIKDKLNISAATLKSLEKEGLIHTDTRENLRNILDIKEKQEYSINLNQFQKTIADDIWDRYLGGDKRPSLIRGVTGSGKTEIYIDLIARMLEKGRKAIVLIPEIALTYQTVIRFYRKFGNRISVINSRLTPAQKHDQLEKARRGDVDIIIGPRSALFTPFDDLGIVIIDEEHEGTYKNEQAPRYNARDVAAKLVQMSGGILVMGSATPSVESYYMSQSGAFKLYTLENRAGGAMLPEVKIVDLRRELESGNRSIISRELNEMIKERLQKNEQVMLFINRRAYQSFVSCRSCGNAIKCPHCDVSLKYHNNGTLMCHYCGYTIPMVKTCPDCGSRYIGTFGAGTQKVEEEVRNLFPTAGVLRMDMDTTREKNAHEKILSAFANHEADILIGTQMIVKGHDFPDVTLVGILAADISLYTGGYMSAERTFQLLTQAAGRAGRGSKKGNVIIQTYSPENYAVLYGAQQNYTGFYDREASYRKLLGYPPFKNMMAVLVTSEDEELLNRICATVSDRIQTIIDNDPEITKIGPADAPVAKIQDKYRKIIYTKSSEYKKLTKVKDIIEQMSGQWSGTDISVTFDFTMRN